MTLPLLARPIDSRTLNKEAEIYLPHEDILFNRWITHYSARWMLKEKIHYNFSLLWMLGLEEEQWWFFRQTLQSIYGIFSSMSFRLIDIIWSWIFRFYILFSLCMFYFSDFLSGLVLTLTNVDIRACIWIISNTAYLRTSKFHSLGPNYELTPCLA